MFCGLGVNDISDPCFEVQNSWKKSLLITVTSTALPWDFYFFKLTQPLIVSTFQLLQLLYTVKEKGGKPDRKPSLWLKKSIRKPQVWEFSRLCQETSTKLYLHEFDFWKFRCESSFCVKKRLYQRIPRCILLAKCQRKLNSQECLIEIPCDNGNEFSAYDQNMFSYTPRLHWSQQKWKVNKIAQSEY